MQRKTLLEIKWVFSPHVAPPITFGGWLDVSFPVLCSCSMRVVLLRTGVGIDPRSGLHESVMIAFSFELYSHFVLSHDS
jgi:hypothetical protein